jgi:membrane fusion protein (multidrug efflux system)
MAKPIIILIVCAALILGGVFAWQRVVAGFIGKFMKQAATAPQTVSTVKAVETSWQSHIEAVGSLRAARGADLAPQASGVVDTIHFESGNDVAAGAVLLRLRQNDDPAKLAQLEATADYAQQTYARDQEQFAAQAISQATLDSDVSTLKSAKAQVAAQQALMDEKIVRAPFAGRLGIRQIDEGQYLAAGTTVVTLQALDPIYVDFYVPQQALAQIKVKDAVSVRVDAYPGTEFKGVIASINSKVDTASRNVQVRASVPNADKRLVPGMYASIEIANGAPRTLVTLPQATITHNPYGDTVFVVQQSGKDDQGNAKLTVQQQFVRTGPTRGDQIALLDGVKAGDVIVSGGQIKLRNGVAVLVNNSVQPANDLVPNPPNE